MKHKAIKDNKVKEKPKKQRKLKLHKKIIFIIIILFIIILAFIRAHPNGSYDPEDTRPIGFEYLNASGDVVDEADAIYTHMWNRWDDYFFNKSSGIQFSNHFNEFWTKNIFCGGYKADGEWHYDCTDSLPFNWNIKTDNLTYVNYTGWRDKPIGNKEVRLGIRYHLKLNDTNLSVQFSIKNIGDSDITNDLGFAWRVKDIQIDNDTIDDKIVINNSEYWLNESLNLTFRNMDEGYYKMYDVNTSEYLWLRWNNNLNYKVEVKNVSNQYNAPTTLGINAGTLAQGQEKHTTMNWIDAGPMRIDLAYLYVYEIGASHTVGQDRTGGTSMCLLGGGTLDTTCPVATPCTCGTDLTAEYYYRIEFEVYNDGATEGAVWGYYDSLEELSGTVDTSDIWVVDGGGVEECDSGTWDGTKLTWVETDGVCDLSLVENEHGNLSFIIKVGASPSNTAGGHLYGEEDTSGDSKNGYADFTAAGADSTPPIVALNSPANDTWNNSQNTMNFSATPTEGEGSIANCSLWNNDTSWSLKMVNTSLCDSGSACILNDTFSSDGDYIWNVECCDDSGNCAFNNTVNYTIHIYTGIYATVETDPAPQAGDVIDDPAIWVHPTDPNKSVIIGTDKHATDGGLLVYNLSGNQTYSLPGGKMNNVDIRYDFYLSGKKVDIAVTDDRVMHTMTVYRINSTGNLTNISGDTLSLAWEPYGFCLYRINTTGKYYAFVNNKSGNISQYELTDNGDGTIGAIWVRNLSVESQPEVMVADDELGYLYVGEEDVGVWRFNASPAADNSKISVDNTSTNGHLTMDVEGLTIYYTSDRKGYLIVSSQGASNYQVYNRTGNNNYIMTFEIIANTDLGIDAVSGSDGIDVTSVAMDSFTQGMFITQDDTNDVGNQNFKLVPWENITKAISPALTIDIGWDPRPDTCTCPTSANWEMDCLDNCSIRLNCDIGDYDLTISGAIGYFEILANITVDRFILQDVSGDYCKTINIPNDGKELQIKI